MTLNTFTVDYSEAITKYNQQLVTQLRDFGDEILNLWVPEEDVIQNLLGIIYSASENKKEKIVINIKRNIIEFLFTTFRQYLETFSEYECIETKTKYTIIVLVNNRNNLNKVISQYSPSKDLRKKIKTKTFKSLITNRNILIQELFSIPSTKSNNDANLFFIKKNQLNYYINDADYYHSNIRDKHLFIKIQKNNIHSIKFFCNTSGVNIFTHLAKVIINTPMIEAFEHGVMKLENLLRKKNINKVIPGIITAFVVKKIFYDYQFLLHDIYKKYLIKNNIKEYKNLYDYDLSAQWKSFSTPEKIKKINQSIKMYCKNSNINLKFVKIEDDVKILIDIFKNEGVPEIEVYSNVLNFEKYIRKNIDKRLEVFYEDRPDDNKLRKKNL